MSSNYPPGVSELPGEKDVEKEYLFEIGGEITVVAYSEEEAEDELRRNFRDLVTDAYHNGDVDVQ